MPSVNVRFTDEQHQELLAAVSRRRGWSLQKEIVERLFVGRPVMVDRPADVLDAVAQVRAGETAVGKTKRPAPAAEKPQIVEVSKEQLDQIRFVSAPEAQHKTFKPDFKDEKPKKKGWK